MKKSILLAAGLFLAYVQCWGQQPGVSANRPNAGTGWRAGVPQTVHQGGVMNFNNTGSTSVTLVITGTLSASNSSGGTGFPVEQTISNIGASYAAGGTFVSSSENRVTVGPHTSASVTWESAAALNVNSTGDYNVFGNLSISYEGGGGAGSASQTAFDIFVSDHSGTIKDPRQQ